MTTINPTKLEDKLVRLLNNGSLSATREFADTAMLSVANQAYNRASVCAESLKHGAMDNLHLLAGILGLGSADPDLSVPRTLCDAGLDFSEVLDFLRTQDYPQGGVDMPTPSKKLVHTLAEALKVSQRRPKNHRLRGVIITADLVIALIDAAETDPILDEVFEMAKVNTAALREELRTSTGDQPSMRHLQPVTD